MGNRPHAILTGVVTCLALSACGSDAPAESSAGNDVAAFGAGAGTAAWPPPGMANVENQAPIGGAGMMPAQGGAAGPGAPSDPGGADQAGAAGQMPGVPQAGAGSSDASIPDATEPEGSAGTAGGAGADAGDGTPDDPGFPDGDYSNPVMPCEMGVLQGSEVVILGDSFYALSGEIKRNLEALAQAAGAPAPYRSYAVSGATLRSAIPGQLDRALQGGPVKLVIMDGGGNDSILGGCPECARIVEEMFADMADNGVQDVLYTFYPDPGNPIGSAPFKPALDELRLAVREVCVMQTALRCHFLDLRPYWEAGDTVDGLHPTASGARHVADAIWAFMQRDCLAQ